MNSEQEISERQISDGCSLVRKPGTTPLNSSVLPAEGETWMTCVRREGQTVRFTHGVWLSLGCALTIREKLSSIFFTWRMQQVSAFSSHSLRVQMADFPLTALLFPDLPRPWDSFFPVFTFLPKTPFAAPLCPFIKNSEPTPHFHFD